MPQDDLVYFRYHRSLNIVGGIMLMGVALSGMFILSRLSPAAPLLLKAFFLLGSLLLFGIAAKSIWRTTDRIILSSNSIVRITPFRRIEIPWNQVIKVEHYRSLFENPGVKITSYCTEPQK